MPKYVIILIISIIGFHQNAFSMINAKKGRLLTRQRAKKATTTFCNIMKKSNACFETFGMKIAKNQAEKWRALLPKSKLKKRLKNQVAAAEAAWREKNAIPLLYVSVFREMGISITFA